MCAAVLAIAAPIWCALSGCGDEPSKLKELTPKIREIPPEAKAAAQDARFTEYRRLLAAQFAALKKAGEFYRKATSGGSHPMSEADLAQHNAMRGECDALAEECFKYADAHFPNESPDVLQQIYDEEQTKGMPEE
jgi:hypothetical protein